MVAPGGCRRLFGPDIRSGFVDKEVVGKPLRTDTAHHEDAVIDDGCRECAARLRERRHPLPCSLHLQGEHLGFGLEPGTRKPADDIKRVSHRDRRRMMPGLRQIGGTTPIIRGRIIDLYGSDSPCESIESSDDIHLAVEHGCGDLRAGGRHLRLLRPRVRLRATLAFDYLGSTELRLHAYPADVEQISAQEDPEDQNDQYSSHLHRPTSEKQESMPLLNPIQFSLISPVPAHPGVPRHGPTSAHASLSHASAALY